MKKVLKIPIYDCKLTIFIVDDDFKELKEKYSLQSVRNTNAMAIRFDDLDYGIAFKSKLLNNHGIIAHEGLHVSNGIFSDIGAVASYDDDEPLAYLHKYIINQCYKVILAMKTIPKEHISTILNTVKVAVKLGEKRRWSKQELCDMLDKLNENLGEGSLHVQ